MQGKMKTFIKDTEAEKEGDKVNVIFLILASSDYFGDSRKSRLGTSFGKRPLLLDFQILENARCGHRRFLRFQGT